VIATRAAGCGATIAVAAATRRRRLDGRIKPGLDDNGESDPLQFAR
jgi:hypothetical protein